jgi:hypothetical protein
MASKGRSVAVGVGEDLAVAEHGNGTVVADSDDRCAGSSVTSEASDVALPTRQESLLALAETSPHSCVSDVPFRARRVQQ